MCSNCNDNNKDPKVIAKLVKNVLGNDSFTIAEKLEAAGNASDDFAEFMEYVNLQAAHDTALLFGIKPVDFIVALNTRKDEMADMAIERTGAKKPKANKKSKAKIQAMEVDADDMDELLELLKRLSDKD